jgi:myo-inositol-1(or 4)-monophosphatase
LATSAAERAGEYIRRAGGDGGDSEDGRTTRPRPHHPSVPPSNWVEKGHHDWVTEVDRTAEKMITTELLAAVPGSRVVGEELSPTLETGGLVWVVDPLDGTTNFLHGYAQYAVSIAAARDGLLEAAVVLDVTRECVYGAVRGGGAWVGGTPLRVSGITDPARALLGTGYPFKRLEDLDRYLAQFRRILPATSGIRRAGSAALDLADVAAGRLDGFWELMLAPWDIAAGILLIREAGGIVTDLAGRDAGLRHSGIVAGNPAIHAWLLNELKES